MNLKVDHACRSLALLLAYVLDLGTFTACRR
jgi:hypothetical protein